MTVRLASISFGFFATAAVACSSTGSSGEGPPDAGSPVADGAVADGAVADAAADAVADAPSPTEPTDAGGAPRLRLDLPPAGSTFDGRFFPLTGKVSADASVTLGYRAAPGGPLVPLPAPAGDGSVAGALPLAPGANRIEVVATDDAGRATTVTVELYFGHRVSVGNSQAALLVNGTLATWGRNELGQLGDGTLTGTWSADDAVNPPARLTRPAPARVSVVTRQTFMVALAKDGTVETWGSNSAGQLGYATPSDCGSAGNSPCGRLPAPVPGVASVVAIAAGTEHVLALRSDGTVLAWGGNSHGQLGDPSLAGGARTTPTVIPNLTDVVSIAAGSAHSVAITRDGGVFVFGNNQYGQLGTGAVDTAAHPSPTRISNLDGLTAASANYTVYIARKNGAVAAWGQNQNGQAGIGVAGAALAPTPIVAGASWGGALPAIGQVAGDGFVGLVLARSGNEIGAFGLGSLGQLGLGTTAAGDRDLANRDTAHRVALPAGIGSIIEIEVGAGGPGFALTDRGELYGWGWSFQGSLGGGKALLNAWAYTTPFRVYPSL